MSYHNIVTDPMYYFSEPSNPPGFFDGRTAAMLGIKGQEVTPETHQRLFDGLNPETGVRLPGMRNVANRRGAWDVTFNQPKAVSVLEQVSQDERIGKLRLKVEREAMKLIESQARVRVAKKSQIEASKAKMPKGWKHPERRSENILTSGWGHPAARDGSAHSHRHWLIYNLAYDKVERTFKTLELRYVDWPGVSKFFDSEMAKGLRKLGYNARYDGKTLSIPDFPKDIHEEFSQRHAAIKEMEKAYEAKATVFRAAKGLPAEPKPMSAKAKGKLSLYDRPEKEHVPIEVRRKSWLSRMSDLQKRVLYGMVEKAKLAITLDRWQAGVAKHVSKLRGRVQEHDHAREAGIER